MRAIIQRVSKASVTINENEKRSIDKGLVVFIGIEDSDEQEDVEWLSRKIANMRIFDDEDGKMNWSVRDINGEILIVSQFTLHASIKKGNRPSYFRAASPDIAEPLYEQFVAQMEKDLEDEVKEGKFGATMDVSLTNKGPVTIIADTKHKE